MTDDRFAEWFEGDAAWAAAWDAADFLAELREAGFEVYRPGECVEVALTLMAQSQGTSQRLEFEVTSPLDLVWPDDDSLRYRLVPQGGEG